MRCCTPEEVTATIAGFSGALIPKFSVQISEGRDGDCAPDAPFPRIKPIPAYTNPGVFTGLYSRLIDSGGSGSSDCCGFGCLLPHDWESWYCPPPPPSPPGVDPCEGANICTSDVLWSLSAFPPKLVQFNFVGSFACQSGGGPYGFINAYNANVTWVTDTSIDCETSPLFCQMPGSSGHYGARPLGSVVNEEDLNGSLVLTRSTTGLRPELYARVNRSKAAKAGDVDAVLRFDVFCRRDWRFFGPPCNQEIIFGLHCTTVQPEFLAVSDVPGEWYCVDYHCGPRYFGVNEGVRLCEAWKCTAAEGFVWPHLIAVSDSGNNSAKLGLELTESSWDDGWLGEMFAQNGVSDKAQLPYEWIVKSVKIERAGSEYEVGDFFTVYFDPAWAAHRSGQPTGFSLTGQSIAPLGGRHPLCNLAITWEDKYGLDGDPLYDQDGQIAAYACQQRLRVSAVTSTGAITEVEVVPWYQEPEYKPNQCVDRITDNSKKTPTYIKFHRNLCHPVSVKVGGSGYSVGDTITWFCKDPLCEIAIPAKAVVTDVDDNGSVLDWHINGSDICMYGYGGHGCGSDPAVRPDCSRHPYESADYLDERGAYKFVVERGGEKFDGKELCYLGWSGKKPARKAVNTPLQQVNTSGLCNVSIYISKEDCRTVFNITRQTWGVPTPANDGYKAYRYESELGISDVINETWRARMLFLFPPYPPANEGGVEIALSFGSEVDPDPDKNLLGGPVTNATVVTGGAGYAFKDKVHVAPTLPLGLPPSGGGSGAKVLSYSFSSVNNFPGADYAREEPYSASASRFSYFPVSGAAIDPNNRGAGYVVGDTLEIKPADGSPYTVAWGGGGDDPDSSPNGGWYEGSFSQGLHEDGRLALTFTNPPGEITSGSQSREPFCTLRVSGVTATGGINSLEVINGGMMFRSVWSTGIKHPEVFPYVTSDTGYGCEFTYNVNGNVNSDKFGEVTKINITSQGHYYANPPSGFMWVLGNIVIGSEIFDPGAMLMAYGRTTVSSAYDAWKPENSTHDLVLGSAPPLVPKATVCHIGECYHPLLNRTYTFFREYNLPPADGENPFDDEMPGSVAELYPPYSWGMFLKKGAVQDPSQAEGVYDSDDYSFIEWGQTITLSASIPSTCPDQTDGRTGGETP
jgi:hypothetical protein